MKKTTAFIFIFLLATASTLHAQLPGRNSSDTLPGFSVKNAGNNRIIIGWINAYPAVNQISIQRSIDSLGAYKSILTVADPMAIQNGYMDTKAMNDHMFYRLYILLGNGKYLFSTPRKPLSDTVQQRMFDKVLTANSSLLKHVNNKDTFLIDGKLMILRSDTIMENGKPVIVKAQPIIIRLDTLQFGDHALPNVDYNKPKVVAFTPSLYVYTNRDGYVRINLPDDEKTKKYSIKFFDENNTFLFELKEIKEKDFKIDKANFYHAGWFWFELYEGSKLFERHKFYLEKDF